MKQKFTVALLIFSMWPLSSIAQIVIADPKTGNALIDFYGRVVDQDGKPLAGAKVVLDVYTGYMFSPVEARMRHDKTTLGTDADGHFTLTGASGHSVKIESIDKDGYELSHTIARLYPYSWAASISHSDPKNPVPFVLWKKGKKPQLIISDKFFDFVPDQTYAVDLKKQKITKATNSEGDFQFRLVRPNGVGRQNKFDWSFSFQAQNGNLLQPTDQGYFEMIFPPQAGYTNAYEETHQASQELWRQGGRKQFYVKMQSDQSYGKIALAWDAIAAANGPKTNESGIRIQYTINPTGSALAQ